MWVKILLLFFVFSFLFKTDHSFDQDLGRHLKLGEIILQTKNVPLTNLFSYTYPDFPFINSHWLFEVLVYLGQQIIGLQTILILKIIIFLVATLLVFATIPKNQYLLLPVGFIFLHTLRERPELRPEIFSFLFTGLTFYILNKFEKTKTKLVFSLPIIQLIWVNTHIYFLIGLILQAIFLIHLIYKYLRFHLEGGKLKLLGIILGLSVATSLINPSGLTGFLNPLTFNQNYGYTIVENQTLFFLENIKFKDPNFLFVKLSIALVILSFIALLRRRRFELKNIMLASFGATLALLNVRSFPYLALISLPPTLENFGTFKSNFWVKILILITIPLLFYESVLYLNGDYYKFTASGVEPKLEFKESGGRALDFVLEKELPQPIFNNFDIGSYITYRGWPASRQGGPKYRVFIDGRPGEYPKEFFQNMYIPVQYDPAKFKELDQKIGFKTIIFSHTDQTSWGKAFLTQIIKNNEWKTVYIDDFMIVLLKNDYLASQSAPLEAVDLTKLDPSSYSFNSYFPYLRLAVFLTQTGNLQSAQKFAQKGLSLFPESPLGNALFGIDVQNRFFW